MLLSGGSGGREGAGASAQNGFAKRVPFWMLSRQDGSGPGWIHQQQLPVFATEISSQWNTDRADLSYSLCCHPERGKCKQVLPVWNSVQNVSGEHPENGFNSSTTGYRSFQRGSITCFKPSFNALKGNSLHSALIILKKILHQNQDSHSHLSANCHSVTPELPNPSLMHTTKSYAVFPFSAFSREHWFILWTTFSIKAAKTKPTKDRVERIRSTLASEVWMFHKK